MSRILSSLFKVAGFVVLSASTSAQIFQYATDISLPQLTGPVEWCDIDNDNDLDIIMMGMTITGSSIGKIAINDSGSYTFHNIPSLPSLGLAPQFALTDWDNDGDMDILVHTNGYGIHLLSNEMGIFVDSNIPFNSLGEPRGIDWGDFDSDGDLDLIMSGASRCVVYRNNLGDPIYPSEFTLIQNDLPSAGYADVSWGDYDSDGDLDVLLSGVILQNNNGIFQEVIDFGTPGVHYGAVAWGDTDNDNDLDAIGYLHWSSPGIFWCKNNDGFDIDSLPLSYDYSYQFGDVNNDGSLDLLSPMRLSLYADQTFVSYEENTLGAFGGRSRFGDYDNDLDLDLVVSGSRVGSIHCKVINNVDSLRNNPPEPPSGLSSMVLPNQRVLLQWNRAFDEESIPGTGITYNVYIGTSEGEVDVLSPLADILTGYRRVVDFGNMAYDTARVFNLNPGEKYWGVQAIDGGYKASPFSQGENFILHHSPVFISSLPYTIAAENTLVSFDYDAIDVDSEALTYSLLSDLDGASIDTLTGEFEWLIPLFEMDTIIRVVVSVNDGFNYAMDTSSISVNAFSGIPVWVNTMPDTTITEGDTLEYDYVASDDVGPMIFALLSGPEGASIDQNSGHFVWPSAIGTGGSNYEIRIYSTDMEYAIYDTAVIWVNRAVSVTDEINHLPQSLSIRQNFPNPFNSYTSIQFGLPQSSHTYVEVYDVTGKIMKSESLGAVTQGWHKYNWNGTDIDGRGVPTGLYFLTISADHRSETIKMLLLK